MKTIGVYLCVGLFLFCSSCLSTSQELSENESVPEVVLYSQDFENGMPPGWSNYGGWDVVTEDGNGCLRGRGHTFIWLPNVPDTDISLAFRMKLEGDARVHVNVRQGRGNIPRYFVGLNRDGSYLGKQSGSDDFQDLVTGRPGTGSGWHRIDVSAVGDTVVVLMDDREMIRYTDRDPSPAGGLSFECISEDPVFIDNVVVRGFTEIRDIEWVRTGGPLGGLGYDIRIDPRNPEIMYVTDAEAGVFKSTDGGRNWRPINSGITTRTGTTFDLIPMFSLSLDPSDSDTLWAGTQGQSGIYKSVDGGENWALMNNGLLERELTFRGFTVHPENPDIVFAAGEVSSVEWAGEVRSGREFDLVKGVVYRTVNGGLSWQRIWAGDNLARYVLINPRNPDIMYVSTGIFDREAANSDYAANRPGGVGILKSTDGGDTWSTVNNGLGNLYIGSLVMHPVNPDILMAGAGVVSYPQGAGAYITTNGGRSWTKTLGSVIESVEFAPSDPNIAYSGNAEAFYRSTDGGRSWKLSIPEQPAWWGDVGISVGHPIDIEVDPGNPDRLFVNAYGGGAFLSTDGGTTWTDASKGYTGGQIRDVDVFPGSDSGVIAAARSGIFYSGNQGEDWTGLATGFYRYLDWHTVSVNPADPEIILSELTCDGIIVLSIDGGRTWSETARRSSYAMGWGAIEWSPSDPKIAYAGTTGFGSCGGFTPGYPASGIWKSLDSGKSWREINTSGTDSLSVLHIAVHPHDSDDVFFASDGQGLWHTADGGANWETVGDSVFGERRVTFVGRHPAMPEVVFAGTEHGGLKMSSDDGRSWETAGYGVNPEATVTDIAFDPNDPLSMYLADQTGGVFFSEDGGRKWQPVNNGLLVRAVNALALTDSGRHLYAATEGGGVYRLDLE